MYVKVSAFFSIFTFSKASLSNQRKYAFATIVISLIDRRSVHNISMDVRNFYSSKCRDMIFYIIIIIILYLEGDIKDKRYRVARRIQDGKKKKKKDRNGKYRTKNGRYIDKTTILRKRKKITEFCKEYLYSLRHKILRSEKIRKF